MSPRRIQRALIALALVTFIVDRPVPYCIAQQDQPPLAEAPLAEAPSSQAPTAKSKFSPQQAVVINRIEEVISNWTKDQHLYVKGDVGISKPQLAKLESWLDENAPHWTIVLIEEAQDESYRSSDNRKLSGMDAVEYALGHGLANRTDFGSLVNEKTGETDGAVFVLFLAERKFSYYGSDIHDRRGLGESHWVGDLDREAKRAMRGGGRIIDAVKNTVSSIDDRLNKKIQTEVAAVEREAAAKEREVQLRRREINNLKSLIRETESEMLPRVEVAAQAVRTNFKMAQASELANPPVEKWRMRLSGLREFANDPKLESDQEIRSQAFRTTQSNAKLIRSEIDRFLDAYAAHAAFEEIIAPVQQRLEELANHPSDAAKQASVAAYRRLDEARMGYVQGKLSFTDPIDQANELLEQGAPSDAFGAATITSRGRSKKTGW